MDFQTPETICKYMTSLIPDGVITVLEPTPGLGNIVRELNGYQITAPNDFFLLDKNWFDAIVMNPPFTPMQKGYDILYRCMDMTTEIIALMPYLTIINGEKRTNKIIDWGLKSITHLPRSTFKGCRVQTCVLQMSEGWKGETIYKQLPK